MQTNSGILADAFLYKWGRSQQKKCLDVLKASEAYIDSEFKFVTHVEC